ncbi:hypothetical protein ACI77J_12460 [Pseudomonas sp. O64]|uniref:hypothetical protein n=1 Tax=Pseudomonas TaxID=286 RepID=UPI001595E90D|nr:MULTISPECIES: hypothetical protein [unclassified Pseudomonas]MCV2226130.1 hypothetical protein [Pseudomonas sp. AU10]UNM22255.1 hypothetical protein K0P33_12705 [Pseudomonas sp. ArH3a]UXZ24892.1 hypothetical protein KZH41_12065 [Pseudomonas sp. YeP6b]
MFRTITASILMMSSCLAAAVDADALSREQSMAIDRYVAAEMARQGLPGRPLGIYRNGRVVLAKGYGFGWEIRSINGHRVVEHGGSWQASRRTSLGLATTN